jgi:hypothetical protein
MRRLLHGLPAALVFAVVAGCVGASARSEPDQPPERFTGPHVEVLCHTSCGRDSLRVVEVAESAWVRSAAVFGGLPRFRPVTVHLVDQDAYAAADRRLNGGRRLANGAFSQAGTRSAWITVSPASLAEHVERLGLPPHTLRGIAHEVYHLVSYQAVRYGLMLPDWLAEGGATWVERQTAEALGVLASTEEDPWASTLLWLAGDRLPPSPERLADLLAEGPEEVHADSGDYGLRLALFAYLMEEEPDLLRRIIRAAQRADRPAFVGGTIAGVVHGTLDAADIARLQRDFSRRVTDWRGRAGWLEGRRHLGTAGRDWLQGGFGTAPAVALRWDPPRDVPYRVRGRVEPLSGDGSSFTVMVDWTPQRAMHAIIRADGLVTLREHRGAGLEKEPGRIVGQGGSTAHPRRGPTAFEVRVLRHEIVLLIDGQVAARAVRRQSAARTRWGLAVSAGGAAIWRDVVVDDMAAPLRVELR